jgi:hypothetical protein
MKQLDLLRLYTQREITGNTALSLIYALYSLPLNTHYGSQSSLVISWQRIFNSISVTATNITPFHSLIPFLPSRLNHSTAISRYSINSNPSWPVILVI